MKVHRAVRFLAFAFLLLIIPAAVSSPSSAQIAVGISVRIGPPALPVYAQPICPGPGYLWTPGYWGWSDDDGYYWVPGTWVVAPVGMLWTPGYWGWGGGLYAWHTGYWGPHIGFYGGINYGFGYGGVGFVGGEWRGGAFFYNTAVMHVDTVHVTNVYVNRTVVVNNESHVAFNGGEGGVASRPTAAEEAVAREPHQAPLAAQTQHEHAASQNRALFASENHGAPAVAATARPGEFSGHNVVAAKAAGAPYHAPAISPREARAPASAANRTNAANNPSNRPFTPPAHAQSATRTENARPQNESHPQSEPKSKPAKAPKHQNAPREQKQEKER
jgi:WXXGXW repeat (2 copies)